MPRDSRPAALPLPGADRAWLRSALVIALALWIPVHMALPLCRDQAIVALVTQRALEGFWPYAGTWDHKGPAAYLLYLPVLALIRDAETAINIGDLGFLGIGFLALRSIGRDLGHRWIPVLGTAALILIVRNDHWTFGQPERWLAALWLVGLAALAGEGGRTGTRPFAIAGAVIGLSALYKPVFVLLAALPLAIALHDRRQVAPGPRLAAAAGAALAIAAALVVPFWWAGRLPDLVDAYITFNLASHAGLAGDDRLTAVVRFVVMTFMPWFDFGAGIVSLFGLLGYRVMRRRAPRAAGILGGAWLAGLACVIAQGKSFHYHFAFAHAAAVPFVAVGVAHAIETVAGLTGRWRTPAILALAVAVVIAANLHLERIAIWWGERAGLAAAGSWEESFCSKDHCSRDLRLAGAYIRETTPPGTPILHFGFDAGLYIAADRPPVSRYVFSYPLIAQTPERLAAARTELMTRIAPDPPALVVVQDRDTVRLLGERSSAAHLAEFPELAALLAARYERAHVAGRFEILRRVR